MIRISDILFKQNLITKEQQATIKKTLNGNSGITFTACVEQNSDISKDQLVDIISKTFKLPSVKLKEHDIPMDVLELIPKPLAKKHSVIPIEKAANTLILAMADPSNLAAMDDISFTTGFQIQPVVALDEDILQAIEDNYKNITNDVEMADIGSFDDSDIMVESDGEKEEGGDVSVGAPVIKLANYILSESGKRGASDIHIEPYETAFRVRLRVDGVLNEFIQVPNEMRNGLIARLKIMSAMKIDEKRIPQDGRIKLKFKGGDEMEYRVNSMPTLFGEKLCLRLLDKSNLELDMTKLGFEVPALKAYMDMIHKPFGMVLVTGPTGSGKTTTLYSALADLNKTTENISTAEDPVEFNLMGINQVNVNPAVGLDFPAALKAFLRQDPDIIMIGEIRDLGTAEIAVKAALTGHLVLSTLHTNSAPETITRILNMGVEPFNIVSALNGVVAQRLGRRLCAKCKTEDPDANDEALIDLGIPPKFAPKIKTLKAVGCGSCNKGYKGRLGLYEVLTMNDLLKRAIVEGKSALDLKKIAMKTGMKSLRQSALTKLAEGIIDIKEVLKNSVSDKKKSVV